ncbi:IS110 family transposase [Gordonia sp. HY285]|uniref:IS110 family transposase n=1 Tax=Gordonia liuliyuniae TaxID=2911517 RepID=UPI001F2CB677|nr:IS110 family transposase [Gordonia liuliyuniae]MCF8609291.1 IS110 family transposase [Gordonia liuliyuniae]
MPDRQQVHVGIDVGKTAHHVCAIDENGSVIVSRRVLNDQCDLEEVISQIVPAEREVEATWALDLTNELAAMVITTLLNSGQTIKYVPGVLVNSMSRTFRGEGKTDARDAKVIAETVRLRGDLATVSGPDGLVNTLTILTSHREELNAEWVAGVNRIRSLIVSIWLFAFESA